MENLTTENFIDSYAEIIKEERSKKSNLQEKISKLKEANEKKTLKEDKLTRIKAKLAEKRKTNLQKSKITEAIKENSKEKEVVVEKVEKKEAKKTQILENIAARKEKDEKKDEILENIAARKEKAEKKIEEKKVSVKESVKVGMLVENTLNGKSRKFQIVSEDLSHYFLKQLGTDDKKFRIKKEKFEVEN